MLFQYTPYVLPLIISSGIAVFVALYVWQRRATASGAVALVMLALACAVWSLGYALEIAGEKNENIHREPGSARDVYGFHPA